MILFSSYVGCCVLGVMIKMLCNFFNTERMKTVHLSLQSSVSKRDLYK